MKNLVLLCALMAPGWMSAQTVNPDIFKKNIEVLYESATGGFKDIIQEQTGETEDGEAKHGSARKTSGAREVFIKIDSETTHTYVAYFDGKDIESAEKELVEIAGWMEEVLATKGLVHNQGTDISYHNYRKHSFEYDTDNIDLMGKYPTISLGILRDTDPPVLELNINEPLWK